MAGNPIDEVAFRSARLAVEGETPSLLTRIPMALGPVLTRRHGRYSAGTLGGGQGIPSSWVHLPR